MSTSCPLASLRGALQHVQVVAVLGLAQHVRAVLELLHALLRDVQPREHEREHVRDEISAGHEEEPQPRHRNALREGRGSKKTEKS